MNESLGKNTRQKQNNNEFSIAFIRCASNNKLLVVRYDGESNSVELCMYETQSSLKNKMTFWQKLKYIYNVLKTGQPYGDQIILQRQQIQELSGFLSSL